MSILDRLAKGEKATKVASEFDIGNSTVNDLKKESRIQSFISSMESLSVCSKECKIMRHADDEKVDEAVYLLGTWCQISLGTSVSLTLDQPQLCCLRESETLLPNSAMQV